MTNIISQGANIYSYPPAVVSAQGLIDHPKLAMIAVNRASMPMVVSDPNQPDNPIVLANGAFLAMSGYTAAEIIGRNCRFLQGPGTASIDVNVIRDAIERRVEVTREILNYRKDGTSFWNESNVSPIFDDVGRLIYYLGFNRDVSSSRRVRDLECAEHLMLREIDHRAMNALALVQSIVLLTRADDCGRYARAVQGRVNALATAHRLLAASNWQPVPIGALVRSALQTVHAPQVRLSGPGIDVDVANIQPLGMVMHEIFENAAQHGALSNPTGALQINWSRAINGIAITFSEGGGPVPVPPIGRGFGLSVATTIVDRQLAGRLDLDWREAGLVTKLTIANAG